jgi:hypothetical protein
MSNREETWAQVLAVPRDFLHGLLGGLLGPVLALAGAIGLVYVLTRRLPAIKEVVGCSGGRQKAVVLASQAEAMASWARFRGALRGAILDMRAQARFRSSSLDNRPWS